MSIALVVTLLVGFLPGWTAAIALGVLLVVLGFAFWRSATNLQSHVKAGAEIIVEALVAQARKRATTAEEEALEQIKHLKPVAEARSEQ